jgi:TctA family transporter
VKRLAALGLQRFAVLNIKRSAALVIQRFAALVVKRFAALSMKRFAALVVKRFAALVVKGFAFRCAVVVVVVYKAHLLTGFYAAEPKVRKARARGGGNKDYWGAYWFAAQNGTASTLDERNYTMRVIIHISGSPL